MLTLRKFIFVLFVSIGYRSLMNYLSGCDCNLDGRLDGLVALVTSADSSLGLATSRGLARRGATVVMTCSVVEECNKARSKLVTEFGRAPPKASNGEINEGRLREDNINGVGYIKPERIYVRRLHLSSAAAITKFSKQFAAEFKKLNILIINSVYLGLNYDRTVEGFERNLGYNYLAGFILSQNFMKIMSSSSTAEFKSRIIFVSTSLHKYGILPTTIPKNKPDPDFNWWRSYTSSQLATVVYAHYLNSSVEHHNLSVAVVNPGIEASTVKSVLFWPLNIIIGRFLKTPWKAAQTTISTTLNRTTGPEVYFTECNAAETGDFLPQAEAGENLFQMTLTALRPYMDQK